MTGLYRSEASDGVSYTIDPITKSDVTVFDPPYRTVFVTTGGVVAFVDQRGVTKTITVPDNFHMSCGVKQILSTNTTAAGFLGYP